MLFWIALVPLYEKGMQNSKLTPLTNQKLLSLYLETSAFQVGNNTLPQCYFCKYAYLRELINFETLLPLAIKCLNKTIEAQIQSSEQVISNATNCVASSNT